jgi:hypothetical protein
LGILPSSIGLGAGVFYDDYYVDAAKMRRDGAAVFVKANRPGKKMLQINLL